jgi:hypothetical protein
MTFRRSPTPDNDLFPYLNKTKVSEKIEEPAYYDESNMHESKSSQMMVKA